MKKPQKPLRLKCKHVSDIHEYNNYELFELQNDIVRILQERLSEASSLLTPTQIGSKFSMTARETNKLLEKMKLQVSISLPDVAKFWAPTNKGLYLCQVYCNKQKRYPDALFSSFKNFNTAFLLEAYVNSKQHTWETINIYTIKWKYAVIDVITEYLLKHPLNKDK